jgi:citrate lyase subunit beta/citryl-CoA lyase
LSIGGHVADYPGHIWHAALSRIVVAAKAAGLEAIDGPFGAYGDLAGMEQSARLARLLGCDGKWAIHPSQIEPLNAIFAPTDEEVARAEEIVQRYRASLGDQRRGAMALRGDLIDAASLRMAERVLARIRPPGTIGK